MRIVAVPGRMVRDHVTGRWVDADGIDIDPNDLTWARYLSDGDVAEETDSSPSTRASAKASSAPASEEPQA